MLIHNGFNESAYAYCDRCGITALFDGWSPKAPRDVEVGWHGPLTPAAARLTRRCACGGQFSGEASPRCPHCCAPLSPERATVYIEANAPGASDGWSWQRTWQGLYAVVIDDRIAHDPWRDANSQEAATD